MRSLALAGTLFMAACSPAQLLRPDPPPPPTPATVSDAPQQVLCKRTAPLFLYVQSQHVGGDGSLAAPYGTIGDALTAGAVQGACDLRLQLLGGAFPESFAVTVPRLDITATGGINIINGAILNTGNRLAVRGVVINAVGSTGIRQLGGRLQLFGVTVTNPTTDPKNLNSGIGLWLSDGAQATIDFVILTNNAHQGLRVEGPGTEAWLSGVVVSNTGIHPGVLAHMAAGTAEEDYWGAVEVTRGAKAIIKYSTITGSVLRGLDVDHSAQALVVSSGITRTSDVPLGPFSTAGAYNLTSRKNASVETFRLFTRDALVDLVLDEAYLTMHHGVVGGADIGLAYGNLPVVPGQVGALCAGLDGTAFTDVVIPMQSGDLTVLPPDAVVDPALCGHVVDDPRPL